MVLNCLSWARRDSTSFSNILLCSLAGSCVQQQRRQLVRVSAGKGGVLDPTITTPTPVKG